MNNVHFSGSSSAVMAHAGPPKPRLRGHSVVAITNVQLLELDAGLASAGTRPFDDDADSRVVATALASRIAGALAALNREQREVLLLHAWADLSHEEISEALGIANGTARSRLSRARAALRAQLGEFDFTLWTFKESDHA